LVSDIPAGYGKTENLFYSVEAIGGGQERRVKEKQGRSTEAKKVKKEM
jgi:hypothetical protein